MPTFTPIGTVTTGLPTMQISTHGTGETVLLNGSVDDATYTPTQIDFTFPFYGVNKTATNMRLSTNSNLSFNGVVPTDWAPLTHTSGKALFMAADYVGKYIAEKLLVAGKSWVARYELANGASNHIYEVTLFADGVIQVLTDVSANWHPLATTYNFLTNGVNDATALDFSPVANQSYVFVPKSDFTGFTVTTGAHYDISSAGTTYTGSGTASGSSSASSAETFIAAVSGTASGVSSVTSAEIVIYAATGSASGSSNVSGNPIVILVASGTAQGSSSVIDSAGGTTYSGAGTASGGSSVIGNDTVVLTSSDYPSIVKVVELLGKMDTGISLIGEKVTTTTIELRGEV